MAQCLRILTNGNLLLDTASVFPDCQNSSLVVLNSGEALIALQPTIFQPLTLEEGALIGGSMLLVFAAAFGFRILFSMRITSD